MLLRRNTSVSFSKIYQRCFESFLNPTTFVCLQRGSAHPGAGRERVRPDRRAGHVPRRGARGEAGGRDPAPHGHRPRRLGRLLVHLPLPHLDGGRALQDRQRWSVDDPPQGNLDSLSLLPVSCPAVMCIGVFTFVVQVPH